MKRLKVIKKHIEGLVSYLPWLYEFSKRTEMLGVAGSTSNADYCYNVFWRHVANAEEAGIDLLEPTSGKTLLELGPGGSMGVGLCGLLAGYDRYIGVDVVPFADKVHRNLQVYDALVDMFKQRVSLCSKYTIWPDCGDQDYPSMWIANLQENGFLEDERLQEIRQAIEKCNSKSEGIRVAYCNPQEAAEFVQRDSCDWIFSQAVLEHVTSIEDVHEFVCASLKPDRFCTHTTDFKAHGMSIYDNGHYQWSPSMWNFLNGRRVLLSNRRLPSEHVRVLENIGMEIIKDDLRVAKNTLSRRKLHRSFAGFSDEDLLASSSFVLARKTQQK